MSKRTSKSPAANGFGGERSRSSSSDVVGNSNGGLKWPKIPLLSTTGISKSLVAAAAALFAPAASFALPNGLEVTGGKLTISQPDGSTLVINQGTSRATGDWSSFDIGRGEKVEIHQPSANSWMLGRVVGGSPTDMQG